MNAHERAMINFALRWAQYGSESEYIFPEFGLSPTMFYERLLAIISSSTVDEIDLPTKRHLRELCSRRLSYP